MATSAAGLAVLALTAGCGVQALGVGAGSRPDGSGSPAVTPSSTPGSARAGSTRCVQPRRGAERTTITVTNSDNKKVLCVLPGVGVFVALHGTPKEFWAAVTSTSAALQRRPNGALSLPVGVTGAFFVAVAPGTATLTSTLRPCPAEPRTHAVARCLKLIRFSVTIKVPLAGRAPS
jgi:hypothetical protein